MLISGGYYSIDPALPFWTLQLAEIGHSENPSHHFFCFGDTSKYSYYGVRILILSFGFLKLFIRRLLFDHISHWCVLFFIDATIRIRLNIWVTTRDSRKKKQIVSLIILKGDTNAWRKRHVLWQSKTAMGTAVSSLGCDSQWHMFTMVNCQYPTVLLRVALVFF